MADDDNGYMSESERWDRYNPGSARPHFSAIATDWPPNKKLVRGYRVEDLIRNLTFGESIFLNLFGRLPSGNERRMFEAVMTSHCSGTYASTASLTARTILATHPDSHVAVAGGLLAFGFKHAGATDECAQMIQEAAKLMTAESLTVEETAERVVTAKLARRERIPGVGHPFYAEADPRVTAVLGLAEELGYAGRHVQLYEAIAAELRRQRQAQVKAHLVLNPEGANVAVVCDMLGDGYDYRASNLWHLIGRIPTLCAAVLEQFQRATPGEMRVPWTYDGPEERDLPDDFESLLG